MRRQSSVSLSVIRRLPKYYRYLKVINDKSIVRVSSKELSEITGFTASQIRQDLNHYGCFGQQGYGYNVKDLMGEIAKIIGVDKDYNMILVGFGNIGHALYQYYTGKNYGYKIVEVFDKYPEKVQDKILNQKIRQIGELESYLEKNSVDIGIIATPEASAQEICDIMCANGVRGIWNYAPIDIQVSGDTVMEKVHLDESLFTLTYFINNPEDFDN